MSLKIVDQIEGQGDTYSVIGEFKDHDVYIRVDGYYSSYDGCDFYGSKFREVRPVQKTITVYE